MLAAAPRDETDSALLERSRFAYPEPDYTEEISCPENRFAEEKTAPRIFLRTEPELRPESLPQTIGTHQENTVFFGTIVLGCVVAPNSGVFIAGPGFGFNSALIRPSPENDRAATNMLGGFYDNITMMMESPSSILFEHFKGVSPRLADNTDASGAP
jgi:hypothetical protein